MAFGGHAAPGEAGRPPSIGHRSGVSSARRPAALVHAWLELLRLFEMRPTALERQGFGGVPGQADRGRIEWAGFDVPAMLVWFAAVEARHFELSAVIDQSSGHDAESDVGRI